MIPDLLDIEKQLGLATELLLQVLIGAVDLAVLGYSRHAARLVSGQFLLLTMARLVVEQALRVPIPSHGLHDEDVASDILVVPHAVVVLLRDVRLLAVVVVLVLYTLTLHFFHVFIVDLMVTHVVLLVRVTERRVEQTVHIKRLVLFRLVVF